MDDFYFKARLSWSKGIERLSDQEAGRLMKALWAFAGSGEKQMLTGREDLVYSMIIGDLEEDVKTRTELSDKRREAANARWHANDANAQNASVCNASDAINRYSKNNSYSHSHSHSNSNGRVNPAQAYSQRPYMDETDKIIANMRSLSEDIERVGKPVASKNPAQAFPQRPYKDETNELVAQMMAWDENAGSGKAVPSQRFTPGSGKVVSAQRFTQRPYSDDTNDMDAMMAAEEG